MAAQGRASSGKKGCSIVVVFIVALLCLMFGFIAGTGAFYGYLAMDDSSFESVGLTPPETAESNATEDSSEEGDGEAASADGEQPAYPLAYPIQETLRIQGNIDENMIRQVVADERFDLGKCYQSVLENNPETKGEMSLQMTIAHRSGEVMAAVVRQNMTGNDELESCIVEELKTWKFDPEKVEGGLAVVRFDALFLPITGKNAPRP